MTTPVFYLLASLYLTGFGVIHTLMVTNRAKVLAEGLMGDWFHWYRLFYNLVSVAIAGGFLWLFYPHDRLVWRWPESLFWVPLLGQSLGMGLTLWVLLFRFDIREFFGIKQILAGPQTTAPGKLPPLEIGGPFRICRHPLYLGTVLLFLFWPFITQLSLVFAVFALVYGTLGSIPEERKLLENYGEAYAAYRKDKKRIIPFVF